MGFLTGKRDVCFAKARASESVRLYGTTCKIFLLNQETSTIDPLYSEPTKTRYQQNSKGIEGVDCPVFYGDPSKSSMSADEGFRQTKTAKLSFAIKDLEDRRIRIPIVGDIIYIWEQYYDVLEDSTDTGYINDNANDKAMIFISVSRRTQALPESLYLQ